MAWLYARGTWGTRGPHAEGDGLPAASRCLGTLRFLRSWASGSGTEPPEEAEPEVPRTSSLTHPGVDSPRLQVHQDQASKPNWSGTPVSLGESLSPGPLHALETGTATAPLATRE